VTALPAIEVRNVSKRFGDRTVLDGVSIAVAPGEIFALLGASGSGKSTLLKIISGIESQDSGAVWLSGVDVTGTPPHRRPVHTVFQNYALFPHLSVADNVAFPLAVAGVPKTQRRQRVVEALSWVRMETMLNRRIQTLSGGERQRVALARALVDGIECVLLDEPLSALDPHLRAATLEFLQEVQARLRVTYLYVTHDRSEALRAAHRIGVLNRGRLEQVGPPSDIYHRPASAYVASFIGPINWLLGTVDGTGGSARVRLACGSCIPLNGPPSRTLATREREPVMQHEQRVQLGVRPEHLRLGEPAFLHACVAQRQFSGSSVSLRFKMDGDASLVAEIPESEPLPGIGEQVPIHWDPGAALVFPEEPAD
jgi:ABC-type Fe3+/spermidine/putrescine transport system ATPase subunit